MERQSIYVGFVQAYLMRAATQPTRTTKIAQILSLMPQLVEITHISRRYSSIKITIPKKVQEKLGIKEECILGFYEEDRRIELRKME